jgi:XTP/dITP diphosphohydrolase
MTIPFIYFASGNKAKAAEVGAILGCQVILPHEHNIMFEAEETGDSFTDNALIKARALYNSVKHPVLADDSGLVIEVLPGELGVRTARFGGSRLSQQQKNRLLLQKMANKSNRRARFICAAVLLRNEDEFIITQRHWVGEIAASLSGSEGFGYDPLFYLPEYQKTAAELSADIKNRISHRALAFNDLKKFVNWS